MLIGICIVLAVAYFVLIIADLTKSRLISKSGIYYPIMLISSAVFASGIALVIWQFIASVIEFAVEGISSKYISAAAVYIFALLIVIMAAYIYVKGNVAPIDKRSNKYENCDVSVIKLHSARRLLITGFAGMFLCFAAAVVLFFFVYKFHELTLTDIISRLLMIVFGALFALLFPIVWVFIIVAALLAGNVIVQFSIVAVAFFLFNMLTANGCIRFILHSEKSKPMKVFFVFLSLINVFNIVYGIICLKRIAAELKQVSNC